MILLHPMESGVGKAHGKFGFEAFSNARGFKAPGVVVSYTDDDGFANAISERESRGETRRFDGSRARTAPSSWVTSTTVLGCACHKSSSSSWS